jgi:predicted component of type VI protein secretion system
MQSRLGGQSGLLGQTLLLGDSFTECDSGCRVIISEVAQEDVAGFLPGGARRRKLEWLLNICLPGNIETEIAVEATATPTVLGEEAKYGYLGYSTYV